MASRSPITGDLFFTYSRVDCPEIGCQTLNVDHDALSTRGDEDHLFPQWKGCHSEPAGSTVHHQQSLFGVLLLLIVFVGAACGSDPTEAGPYPQGNWLRRKPSCGPAYRMVKARLLEVACF